MPYEFYKVAHVVGFVVLFMSFGAMAASPGKGSKMWAILHGVSLLVVLVAGFGLAARLGLVSGFPGWIWAKIGIWVLLGAMIAMIRRMELVKSNFWLIGTSAILIASYLAVYKPF